ncbi:MAG: hypothetical protein JO002_03640 [Burkholderiaceae bacterium]|nr:hypothetical protein [Burkholderiaceae bacterium]
MAGTMDIVKIILLAASAGVVLANMFVSYRVVNDDTLERHQKYFQCALIWLLPLLGAGLCYALTREPEMKIRGYSKINSLYDDANAHIGYGDGPGGYHGGGDQ